MEYIDIKKLIDVIRRETKKHANTKERVSRVLDELLDFTKNNYQLIGNYVSQEDLNNYLNNKLNVDGSNLENLEEWKIILNYYDKTETYSQTQIDNIVSDLELEIDNKANSSDVYLKTQTYSQTEINDFLSGKQNSIGYIPENSANKSDSYTASSSTTYASTKALVDGLATKIDKGTYTGNAQDLKNDIETKQKQLSSFDESILIESDGNIEGNVSLFTEYFQQQICVLNFIPTQIIGVYQDGIKLLNSEYEIILPKKIKIKEYIDENIQIEYTHLKS